MEKGHLWRMLAYASLLAVTLCIDTVGGMETYPPFAASDEIQAGHEAPLIPLGSPTTWLVPWNMASGYEQISEIPLRIAQIVFGRTLGGGRMAHVFFGSLVVLGLFGFAQQLIGAFPAWCAAMLLACSHVHIALSRAFICTGIQSATAVVLWLWVLVGLRKPQPATSWIPRALLAGFIMGWGVQTYKIAYGFPFLALLTLIVWRRGFPAHWLIIAGLMLLGALPIAFLWAWWMYQHYPASFEHVTGLSLMTDRRLGDSWAPAVFSQFRAMGTMWWTGRDAQENYGARIPVLDPVTGGAFAVGLLYAVWQWRSTVSLLVAIWLPALMLGAIGLVNNGAGYYRLSCPLIFVCLLSGWGATSIMYRLFPMRLAQALCIAMLATAAYYNLSYYFVQYPREVADRSTAQFLLLVSRVCHQNESEEDRRVLVEPQNDYLRRLLQLQCPAEQQRVGIR